MEDSYVSKTNLGSSVAKWSVSLIYNNVALYSVIMCFNPIHGQYILCTDIIFAIERDTQKQYFNRVGS